MKYYCPKCFNKIEYKFNKPEKCPKCSFAFASLSVNNINIANTQDVEPKNDFRETERRKIEKRIQLAESLEAKRVSESEDFYSEEKFEDEYDMNYEWRPGLSKLKKNPGIYVEIKKEHGVSLGSVLQEQSSHQNNDFKDWKRQPNHLTKEQIIEEIRRESSGPANVINID